MAKPRLETFTTLQDLVAFLEARRAAVGGPFWYRGCGRSSHELKPSLYRHRAAKSTEDFSALELQLIERFRQRSIPFISRSLQDIWETLFLMQHYGIPTRLLDWSENPFVAFFFAVMTAIPAAGKKSGNTYVRDAAIWILDPVAWNRHALAHQSYTGGVLGATDPALSGYAPKDGYTGMNNYPVAMYGAHNSQRIVAQRGVFTVFGQSRTSMEALYAKGFPADCLIKGVMPRANIADLRRTIIDYGITDSVVFPDLEGLAREIKRSFGFEL